MITSFTSAIKNWVFAKNGNEMPIARTVDFVVDPQNGKIAAIWIASTDGLKILAVNDILRWKDEEILITDNNELLKSEEFPKITTILGREVSIIGAKVFDSKTKQYLGKVRNFTFDTISPRILSIHIQKGIWPFCHRRIIPRTQIVKISKKGVFIKNEADTKAKIVFGNKKIANLED